MKLYKILPLFLLLAQVSAQASVDDAVYGDDNRFEAYERPSLLKESRAVAAMVSKRNFTLETLIGYQITASTHEADYNLCRGEKFAYQPILPECTGFLVASDVLITAGHCITGIKDCNNFNWVFGYEMSRNGGNPKEMDRRNVYQCKSIIARSLQGGPDYAIIKLDRPTGREPLKLAPKNQIAAPGTNLVMMGYPSGLPLKITEGAQVLRNRGHVLVTNLDAFHVNSGSPVLDQRTNQVIGILVAGAEDYRETTSGCMVVNQMDMSKGEEEVTSMSVVPRNF